MIEKVEIENFKSIRKLDLRLGKINVLIGANGAGKSNFIAFFKLLYNIYNQSLQSYIAESGGADNLLYFGRKSSESISGLVDFDNTNAYYFTLKPTQRNNFFFDVEGDYFNVGEGRGGHGKKRYRQRWHDKVWEKGHQESSIKNSSEPRAQFLQQHFKNFRIHHFHDTSPSAKIKQLSRVSDNRMLREDGSNLAAFLYFLQQKYPAHFKRVEAVVHSIAPFFDRFDLNPDRTNPEFIQLEWLEKGSDMYLNAHNLSDGTLRMIALTTLLLQPRLPKTIIIDEPELGLHPVAINKLAAMLKTASQESQIILSTQSVNLVDNFSADDIIAVDREDRQSVFRHLDEEELKSWLEDYTLGELWNKNIIGATP